MAGREDVFEGVQLGIFEDKESLAASFSKHVKTKDVFFLCVGTDRISGDSFAPFVGSYLKELGYENVLGTIDEPVHALNLDENIAKIPSGKTIIAIDASLGKEENIGKLVFNTGKLHAGRGVGKTLTPVGDYNIHGVVSKSLGSSISKEMSMTLLAHTRLSMVLKLARRCADAIEVSFPLEKQGDNRILKLM
jgi:putative sporulation protein YyaC